MLPELSGCDKAESIAEEISLIASVILLSVKFKLNVGVSEVFVKLKEKFWERSVLKKLSVLYKGVGFVFVELLVLVVKLQKVLEESELLLVELLLAELLLVELLIVEL